MLVEGTNNDKIVITLSSSVDRFGLRRLIDYVNYLETASKSKAKQSDVNKLADEVNSSWRGKNRKRFISEVHYRCQYSLQRHLKYERQNGDILINSKGYFNFIAPDFLRGDIRNHYPRSK